MVDYRMWGVARVTPYMAYQLDRLNAELRRLFGVGLVANSGIRTAQEQLDIWYSRYTRTPNGRKVYDTRWRNGQLWYRVSPAGTVAQPGTSNHEIQGSRAAVDIADTGNDAGITSKNSTRGRWLRQNAGSFDMVASGDGFGEGWHFDINNIFASVPGAPAGGGTAAPAKEEYDTMILHRDNDRGSVFFVDEFGADHLLDYGSADIQFAEYVNAAQKAWETKGFTAREWDIINAIANRRWAAKRAQIVNDTVSKLIPVIEKGQAVALDPELVKSAIKEALDGVEIDTTVDGATIDKIADTVLNKQHARLAE